MTIYARYLMLFLGGCSAALAVPARAVTQSASVNAQVVKPLTLTAIQDLNLGTITLGSGSWSGATIGISQAGVFSCSLKVTCTGVPQPAQFNVTGTNKMVVLISAPSVTLVNQNNSAQTLNLTIDSPGQVTLPNAGQQGINFNIGGSVTISSTTVGGTYRGTINVTANYQ
ncbi:MAG TPA: DUF4402 domain-containing protein [Sphingomicrobium sp.]|jgi:hypothetical protein|nr:DUF4402 domain-containing protein [Sphingomicrobium sp.]